MAVLVIYNFSCQAEKLLQHIEYYFQGPATMIDGIPQRLGSLQTSRLRFVAGGAGYLRHLVRGLSQGCMVLGLSFRIFQHNSPASFVASGLSIKRSLLFDRRIFPPTGQKGYQDHLNEATLFEKAKDITPQLASAYLERGVQIDKAKGPDGETVWHAVVKYHRRPNEMLDWLFQNSRVPCHLTCSHGNTPLMLAIQLGRVDLAKRLIKHGDLNVVNPWTKFTAPELVARSQSPESVDIFRTIMANLSLNEDNARKTAKKLPRAIYDGLYRHEEKLRLSRIRKNRACRSQVQEHTHLYEEKLSIAESHALQKLEILALSKGS